MWRSIRHLHDWAMRELLTPHRLRPGPEAIHASAELAGLVLSNQPVPWNAEAVVVEACLRLPPTARRKDDFLLRLPGRVPLTPESLRPDGPGDRHRAFFRLPPPASSTIAELTWCDRPLGRIELTVLSKDTFLDSLKLQVPTLHARLGDATVACQTFVASQCTGLLTGGLLTAPTSLAPLVEVGLVAEVRGAADELLAETPVPLSGSQLAGRQALVTAAPRRLPKRSGQWGITWKVGDRVLANVRARAVSQGTVHRSLRVVGTRFVVDDGTSISVRRQIPPGAPPVGLGPCFLVASSEPGMAARCTFEIAAVGGPDQAKPMTQSVLVTDGPTPVAPATLPAESLAGIQAFELRLRGRTIGTLPLHPVPSAKFTAEGGFVPPPDFAWTPAAEEELGDRLAKLMGG